MLVTTDFTLEGTHFRREWHPPEVVGRRCLTRGLSDIAAMGGEPVAAFLSLALPAGVSQKWVDGFIKGLLTLATEFRAPLAGGDIAESMTGVLADILVVGSIPQGRAVLRSGAKLGDKIYVTGSLGGSAAAIANLRQKNKVRARDYERHFHPTPRLKQGAWLRERGLASAMIDLSDGLSTDLEHICKESGVGAEVDAESIPLAIVGRPARPVACDLALHGGEDYELLFTSSKQVPSKVAGVPITRIGRITRKPGMMLIGSDHRAKKLLPRGWEHFTRRL
jgi:thiamine-monophosphate kinase